MKVTSECGGSGGWSHKPFGLASPQTPAQKKEGLPSPLPEKTHEQPEPTTAMKPPVTLTAPQAAKRHKPPTPEELEAIRAEFERISRHAPQSALAGETIREQHANPEGEERPNAISGAANATGIDGSAQTHIAARKKKKNATEGKPGPAKAMLPERKRPATRKEAPALPPVISLPLNDGAEFPITQASLDEWRELYPAVDVPQALRNMRGWLLGNPTRRKTRRGIGRFIHAWLSREQDRGQRAPAWDGGQPRTPTEWQYQAQEERMLLRYFRENPRDPEADEAEFRRLNGIGTGGKITQFAGRTA